MLHIGIQGTSAPSLFPPSAPFFDLLLDVAEDGTDRFVLMLTPPVLPSPFSKDVAWAMCYMKHLTRMKEALHSPSSSYDVGEDYEKYYDCIVSIVCICV